MSNEALRSMCENVLQLMSTTVDNMETVREQCTTALINLVQNLLSFLNVYNNMQPEDEIKCHIRCILCLSNKKVDEHNFLFYLKIFHLLKSRGILMTHEQSLVFW